MIFLATGIQATATTKTALTFISTANIRPRLLSFNVSTDGVPTSDQSLTFQLRRFTADGTGTAYTYGNTDPSDSAMTPLLTSKQAYSVEPTYASGFLMAPGVNPRNTWKWWPETPDAEIILPATASNGIGWQQTAVGGSAGNLIINAACRQ